MMSYIPFWEQMNRKGINTYKLENQYELNPAEIDRLKKEHNFTVKTLERYCKIFDCNISDIVTYIPDKKDNSR